MSGNPAAPAAKTTDIPRWVVVACVAVILGFAAFVRIRLLEMPLERDEGEYAYARQLMLQGIPPYKLAYNMKLPGTYVAYALILALFGQTPAGIHLGVLLVNSATVFMVFLLSLRLAGLTAALVAGASYALLSVSPSVLGLYGHATHFVALMAVGGLLLLLRGLEKHRHWLFFGSGICLGLAFVMKQPGLLFVIFGALYLLHIDLQR